MQEITVGTSGELQEILAGFGAGYLFRGQTAHFEHQGYPSVVTSFDRKGCIPSAMLRWSHYADKVLEAWVGPKATPEVFSQALLQHYGWRSFYVDCSASPGVAAWFASHTYSDRIAIEMSEDYEERPVMLRKRHANYALKQGEGHLYVIDRDRAHDRSGTVDLAGIAIDKFRVRPMAQQAWLVGPLREERLDMDCLVAHIRGDRAIFRDCAAAGGFIATDDLFPPRREDPILDALLGLPWIKISGIEEKPGYIDFYERPLDLPEYQDSYVKINSERVAFFHGARVADGIDLAGASDGGIVVAVPDIVMFGTPDPAPLLFPKVRELVREHRLVAFEVNQLVQHATLGNTAFYQKGIVVWEHEPDLIELCELMVEHPGLDLTRASLTPGWYYRVDGEGSWHREPHEHDCDCGTTRTHLRHVSALYIIEAFLREPKDFSE
ncbi:MAG TPA: FRG domain-containing protein [Stellaceae bacterium]|nr:FRG domain-containing protein [Stellaceae bacterium]